MKEKMQEELNALEKQIEQQRESLMMTHGAILILKKLLQEKEEVAEKGNGKQKG